MSPAEAAALRPRIEGDREQEILEAALAVLTEMGYDRLTMDAVAARAKAGKATLYRRWSNKLTLVIEALMAQKGPTRLPDTGTLRGDLVDSACGIGGLCDPDAVAQFTAVLTAITRDAEFAEAFRREVISAKTAVMRQIYTRAQERGEIGKDIDLDVIAPAMAGILLHRFFLLGELPDPDAVARVVDHVILPAVTAPGTTAPSDPIRTTT